MKPSYVVCSVAFLVAVQPLSLFADTFGQTNLVSDIPGTALVTDTNLKNPWGMSFSKTSPIWVSDQATAKSTLYTGTGVPAPLIVSVPPTSPPPTGPTGQVFNSAGSGNFMDGSSPAIFMFSTLAGTIDAWNASNGTTAAVKATTPGAVYTGLALANNGSGNFLYTANFVSGGGIDVFDSAFAATKLSGSFTDPNALPGYSPYNVQAINGKLYVEYAQFNPANHMAAIGTGLGYVDVFDTNGNFLQRLATGGQLDAPWGVAIAPVGFGNLGNDVLIGNFGNGEINAYTTSGTWVETLSDSHGAPLVNSGLWGIAFGNPSANPMALYFAAGINNQADGLFGDIVAIPEPSTWMLGGLGLMALIAVARTILSSATN
jgi:uncharacterized protein (TIGR03118 family)